MLSICILVFLVFFQWPPPTALIHPGTVINVGDSIIDTKPMIEKFKKFMSGSDGRQLKVKLNGGCVDAGHHSADPEAGDILTPYVNQQCPEHPWTKWLWDGDYLKVGWASDYPGTFGCLGFWDKGEAPSLEVFSCVDISTFLIRFHPRQFDFSRLELFFSIHSKVYQSKCLGIYNKDLEIHPSYRGNANKTVRRDVFQLQECYGLDHQSFYLEDEQFDVIDKLKQKIFGPEGMVPWDRQKDNNCTLLDNNRINTL